jgi:hypothetical protein
MRRLVQLIADYDRAGNLTTRLSRPPAEAGERVRVEIGDAGGVALVATVELSGSPDN